MLLVIVLATEFKRVAAKRQVNNIINMGFVKVKVINKNSKLQN